MQYGFSQRANLYNDEPPEPDHHCEDSSRVAGGQGSCIVMGVARTCTY